MTNRKKPFPSNDYEIINPIKERYSPRAFDSRPVSEEHLLQLFEAARWTASCFNEQPWRYVVATAKQQNDFNTLLSCLAEGNQQWVKHAPVMVCAIACNVFSKNGKVNKHAWHDVGQANAAMAIQATALGLSMHQMAGFDDEKTRKRLSIPEHHDPVAFIAIGYASDDAEHLEEWAKEKEFAPQVRRSQSEFVFSGKMK